MPHKLPKALQETTLFEDQHVLACDLQEIIKRGIEETSRNSGVALQRATWWSLSKTQPLFH